MEIYFKENTLANLYEGNDDYHLYSTEFIYQFIKAVKKIHSVTVVDKLNQYISLQYQKQWRASKKFGSILINDHYRLVFEELITDTNLVEIHLLSIVETSKYYLAV